MKNVFLQYLGVFDPASSVKHIHNIIIRDVASFLKVGAWGGGLIKNILTRKKNNYELPKIKKFLIRCSPSP